MREEREHSQKSRAARSTTAKYLVFGWLKLRSWTATVSIQPTHLGRGRSLATHTKRPLKRGSPVVLAVVHREAGHVAGARDYGTYYFLVLLRSEEWCLFSGQSLHFPLRSVPRVFARARRPSIEVLGHVLNLHVCSSFTSASLQGALLVLPPTRRGGGGGRGGEGREGRGGAGRV
jgi:hypothetical protein